MPDGKRYRLVILKVETWRDDIPQVLNNIHRNGKRMPDQVVIMDDNDVAELAGGEHFFTAYLPEIIIGESAG